MGKVISGINDTVTGSRNLQGFDIDRVGSEVLGHIGAGDNRRRRSVADTTAIIKPQRIGDYRGV